MNAKKPPEPPSYEMLYSFVDPSASYVLGFEAGRLAHRMERGESPIADPLPVHAKNTEQIRLMAAAYGYAVDIVQLDPPHEEWASLRLTLVPPDKPKRHLRAV